MGKNPRSRANNSKVNNPNQPKFELFRAFMSVLVTCMFDKDPIKDDRKAGDISFSPLKGTLLQNDWSDTTEIRTRLRVYACPSCL